ncbi:MAG: hypothetical protein ACRYGG_13180 [Janthinobacterium lividum]
MLEFCRVEVVEGSVQSRAINLAQQNLKSWKAVFVGGIMAASGI